jgi:hypothetical protein
MIRNNKGQFIKGSNGNTYEGFGIWYDRKGYPSIWINGKTIKLHIYIWEKIYGNKPKHFDIHHKDFDKKNYSVDNLELLSFSDHRKLHAGWVRENGQWIKKPCKACKQLLPLDNFYPRKGLTPSNVCKKCSLAYWKEIGKNPEYKKYRKIYMKKYYEAHK